MRRRGLKRQSILAESMLKTRSHLVKKLRKLREIDNPREGERNEISPLQGKDWKNGEDKERKVEREARTRRGNQIRKKERNSQTWSGEIEDGRERIVEVYRQSSDQKKEMKEERKKQ